MKKVIEDLKVEKKNLENAVGLLRTEFVNLGKVIQEQKNELQRINYDKEKDNLSELKKIEEGQKQLAKSQQQVEVEKVRTKVILDNALEQREKNVKYARALKEKEAGLKADEDNLKKREGTLFTKDEKLQGLESELHINGNKIKQDELFIEDEKERIKIDSSVLSKGKNDVSKERKSLEAIESDLKEQKEALKQRESGLVSKKGALLLREKGVKESETEIDKERAKNQEDRKEIEKERLETKVQKEKIVNDFKTIENAEKNLKARDIELKKINSVILEKQSELKEKIKLATLKNKGII